jgi:heme A synthase
MTNTWPHRCAILLAAVSFLLVATGTAVTSSEERPYYSLGQTHIWLGVGVAVLAIVLAVQILKSRYAWMRRCGWTALAIVALQTVLGFQPLPQPPAVRVLHTLAGQLFFPLTLAMAVCTSEAWGGTQKRTQSSSWLWSLSRIAPFVVFAQVVLGALFRHGALGLGPHLLGAFVMVFFVLGLGLPVITRAEYRDLHTAARVFLTVAHVQVLLGLTLFIMQIMEAAPEYEILFTIIHAAMATLTLAATTTLAALIRHASYLPGVPGQSPGAVRPEPL